jgi:hypothetical protein
LLKPQINQRVNQHNEIIAVLAEVGEELDHEVWIGKKEQSENARGIIGSNKSLKSYVSADLTRLRDVKDLATVERIDLIWIRDSKVVAAFEVESTTTMTSGLVRGSNLPSETPKYLVIPEERDEQLKRKMKSPMFGERFVENHWSVLYFDTLRANYRKLKTCKVTIQDLVGEKMKVNAVREAQQEYTFFSQQGNG